MGHHHAISTDIQYKVNYAIYTFQDCGYIILLFVGGAVVGELGSALSLSLSLSDQKQDQEYRRKSNIF